MALGGAAALDFQADPPPSNLHIRPCPQVPHRALHSWPALVLALHAVGRALGRGKCVEEGAQVSGSVLAGVPRSQEPPSRRAQPRARSSLCLPRLLRRRRAAAKKGRPADEPAVPTSVAWPLFQVLLHAMVGWLWLPPLNQADIISRGAANIAETWAMIGRAVLPARCAIKQA